jgi:ubiquinone/menaquinone biosynthesis C-methylase UbiE
MLLLPSKKVRFDAMNADFTQKLRLGDDGIYSTTEWGTGQEEERLLRKRVADEVPADLVHEIGIHHSFSVMDREVERFVRGLPSGAVILDVGGCWGWHWRNMPKVRPDVRIVIMDFVRENLARARFFLGDQINKNIILVHGDGTKIPFANEVFDGYWAVQTLQHIPMLEEALKEAYRVLKSKGHFSMINLNNPVAIRSLYKALGRTWVDQGVIDGMYFFRRSGDGDAELIKKVFHNASVPRFSEILFKPELNMHGSARPKHWLGRIDSWLSSSFKGLSLVARQRGYSAVKVPE